jgi:hypothetical protein
MSRAVAAPMPEADPVTTYVRPCMLALLFA